MMAILASDQIYCITSGLTYEDIEADVLDNEHPSRDFPSSLGSGSAAHCRLFFLTSAWNYLLVHCEQTHPSMGSGYPELIRST